MALGDFPDAEAVGMALLGPVGSCVQTTPPEITGRVVQVIRVGGADNGITDEPLLHVACYSTTYDDARAAAEQARQIILAAGGTSVTVDGRPVLIDSARTATAPAETPLDNPDLRRKTATFQLTYRRPRA